MIWKMEGEDELCAFDTVVLCETGLFVVNFLHFQLCPILRKNASYRATHGGVICD